MTTNPQQAQQTTGQGSQVAAAHRTAWLVVILMAVSIAVYTAIGVVVVSSAEAPVDQPSWLRGFYVAALFLALGSVAIRRTQLRWLRLQVVAGLKGVEGLVKHFANVTIISAALAEAIGMLGLLSSFLGGGMRDVLTFGVISMLVVLFSYPRRDAWERTINYFASNAPGKA
jgi:hypothetical protein